jgi:hypothetical protein
MFLFPRKIHEFWPSEFPGRDSRLLKTGATSSWWKEPMLLTKGLLISYLLFLGDHFHQADSVEKAELSCI